MESTIGFGDFSFALVGRVITLLGRSFYLQLGIFYLCLVFVAYGNLLGLLYLRLEFGLVLFCLRRKISLVFLLWLPQSGNWIWSLLLTVPPP